MKAVDYQEAERFHASIAEATNMDWLRWTRSTIVGLIDEASDDDGTQRLVALIDTRNRIDRRLCELENPASCNSRTPASRKTPHRRPRGYIENYAPQRKTTDLLERVVEVLEGYRQHWPLTCRQVFYRMVGAHGYDKSEAFYARLCHHLGNARRGRMIPFEAIRDDGVATVDLEHFDDADHFRAHVRELAGNYRRNVLTGQDLHVEVHCEAAGMIFQLAEVAHEFSVPVYSSSGFDSLTAKKNLARRICRIGKPAVILHLGDWDPSGEAIFDAVTEDVAAFVVADRPWATITVRFQRVALTGAQVEAYQLPTAPPKATDSRAKGWQGQTCQLEALAPDVIAGILKEAIASLLDEERLQGDRAAEVVERRHLALALPAPGGA
ncbi:MAG: hypothetical protein ABJP67_14500 [Nitratireductor sp.]|uniref:hypothetical protein n=1 Tax=Bauldia litoralis TaxID=665467 RepID=UPI0032639668